MECFVIKGVSGPVPVTVFENASPTALSAGRELCRYLELQCGTAPVFSVGKMANSGICIGFGSSDYGADEFELGFRGDFLFIDGGNRGVLYGVFELLERLGFRFFTEDCTRIPKTEILETEKKDVRAKPVFEYRCTNWRGMTPALAPRLRINALLGRSIPQEFGGDIHYAGFVHTLGDLSEMEKTDGGYTDRQPCLSDEKVFETVMKNLSLRLRDDPGATIASVSQNDSHEWGRGCQCEKCLKADGEEGTPMGSLLRFVNRVGEAVKKDFPDVAVDTLAYRYTRKAPRTLRADENVIVRLCSIECCFSHPIESCDRSVYDVEDGSFASTLKNWRDRSNRIYIWDYTTNFQSYHNMFPNFRVLRQNLRFFAENNVKGVFEQGDSETVNGEFGPLRTYLIAKLLWDPYMSEETYETHILEFMTGYYGAAGEHLMRFLDRLCRSAENVHYGIYFADPTELFSDPDTSGEGGARAFLEKGRADFARAKAAVSGIELERVCLCEFQLDLYEWFLLSRSGDISGRRALGEKLLRKARDLGISAMHEGGAGFLNRENDPDNLPCFW
ncbi:MAG: DUF4838 domain-containing protein [Clostridia bacterium]|nr:DUF4838 domain-containing protein [Clostridia bacterium]